MSSASACDELVHAERFAVWLFCMLIFMGTPPVFHRIKKVEILSLFFLFLILDLFAVKSCVEICAKNEISLQALLEDAVLTHRAIW